MGKYLAGLGGSTRRFTMTTQLSGSENSCHDFHHANLLIILNTLLKHLNFIYYVIIFFLFRYFSHLNLINFFRTLNYLIVFNFILNITLHIIRGKVPYDVADLCKFLYILMHTPVFIFSYHHCALNLLLFLWCYHDWQIKLLLFLLTHSLNTAKFYDKKNTFCLPKFGNMSFESTQCSGANAVVVYFHNSVFHWFITLQCSWRSSDFPAYRKPFSLDFSLSTLYTATQIHPTKKISLSTRR